MKTSNIKVLIGSNRTSTTIQNLQLDAVSNGATPYPEGDHVIYPIYQKLLTLDIARSVVAEGGVVSDFKVFFEVASLEDLVPLELPNSQGVNEDESTYQKNWTQWHLSTNTPTVRDGRIFVSCTSSNDITPLFSEVANIEGLTLVHINDIPVSVTELV